MTPPNSFKVVHVITDLDIGGAENVLASLVDFNDSSQIQSCVISLSTEGPLAERIKEKGIPVYALGMKRSLFDIFLLPRLAYWLWKEKPDVVQTWLYHADLIGGLIAKISTSAPVIWNIRHSDLDPKAKFSIKLIRKILANISSWLPAEIIACSSRAANIHTNIGYSKRKIQIIANGVDVNEFIPDPNSKKQVRRELNIDENDMVIGMVARFHPQKDHRNFIRAIGETIRLFPKTMVILCGNNVDYENDVLVGLINSTGFKNNFRLLGIRRDIPSITSAFDIAVLSASHGEAFPNVVVEAMSCEIPCVVTDVGDAADIVGKSGIVVETENWEMLHKGIVKLLRLPKSALREMGKESRRRIQADYSLENMIERYRNFYFQIVLKK